MDDKEIRKKIFYFIYSEYGENSMMNDVIELADRISKWIITGNLGEQDGEQGKIDKT